MKFINQFQNELAELLINEDKISYFTNLMCMGEKNTFSDCMYICNALIDFCEKNNLNRAKSYVLYYYGWACLDSGKFEDALNTFMDMRELVQKIDYVDGLILAYNALISIYCTWGNYALAKQYGVRGLTLAKKKKKSEYYLKLLINMAITNTLFGAYDEALEILDYAKNFMTEKNTDWIVYYKSIAEASVLSGDFLRGETAVEAAIEYAEIEEDTPFVTEIFKLRGMLKIGNKEYESAKEDFSKAFDYADKCGYEYEKLETVFEWSKLYLSTGEDDKYLDMLKDVKRKGIENKYRRIVEKTSQALFNYYDENNNDLLALDNLEDIISLKTNKDNDDLEEKDIRFDIDFDIKLKQILYDRGEILFQISSSVLTELEFSNLRTALNTEIRKIIDVKYVGLGYYDEDLNNIVFSYIDHNNSLSTHYQNIDNDEESFVAYCFNKKRAIFMNNINKEYKYYINNLINTNEGIMDVKSTMFVPIINENKSVGVITIQSNKENEYTYRDLNLLKSIATYLGIAIANARAYKKLEQVAMYDSLTGFLTRREILRLGEDLKQIRKSKLDGDKGNIYIGMIDIDNFKNVNDSFGHVVGDILLKLVAKTIIKNVRNEDYIGRYGGDEFLVISSNIGKSDMFRMLERVRKQIETTEYELEGCLKHQVTISVGLHELDDDEGEFIKSVDFADKALYKVKKTCKNKVYIL